ncbi:DUF177 domain-containing protein [uncultured Sphingomonas sp.]|uniref:YceD family protein n=1 Tax=uncultured Sphingomonas sp. TaxID=158754 RepID=UPI0035CB24A2
MGALTAPALRPEFSRPERVDTISGRERVVELEARPAEREALARRFGLLAVESLGASFAVAREHGALTARGRVTARVVQACSITDEPVASTVDERADLLFVPAGPAGEAEVELSADALDTIIYEGREIDLGEAAAETMALALDPFPRAPGADRALREAGVLTEEEARPLGKLAGLRDKLEGR